MNRKGLLNFDRNACSYFLLQMNTIQRLFQINIINLAKKERLSLWGEHLEGEIGENQVLDWFDDYVNTVSQGNQLGNISSWIGVTSKYLPRNLFATTRSKNDEASRSQKNIALITTDQWERSFSPPSVFEYILFIVLKIAISFLQNDFEHTLPPTSLIRYLDRTITRGCIFDVSWFKAHRRFGISTPTLCIECSNKVKQIEQIINEKEI